jgi:hypothetical protein
MISGICGIILLGLSGSLMFASARTMLRQKATPKGAVPGSS